MKINLKKEYVIIIGLLLVIVFFSDFLRIILGLAFALFLPGYLLMAVLFPEKDEIDGLARFSFSVGLSIIIVPLIGLLLNYLSVGVRLMPMMLSLMFLDIFLLFFSWYRRTILPEEKRFSLTLTFDLLKWSNKTKGTNVIHRALLMSGFLIIFTSVFIISSPKTGNYFTEFYIASLDDVTSGYPRQLQVGENVTIKAVIINNEHQKTRYRMEILVDGNIIQTISPIDIENQEKQEITVMFKLEELEELANVEFLLYRDGQDMKPYRQLRLWVEILPDSDQ